MYLGCESNTDMYGINMKNGFKSHSCFIIMQGKNTLFFKDQHCILVAVTVFFD